MNREQYAAELARILRELLAAGSKRDFDKMLELAKDIEQLARVAQAEDGNPDKNPG